MNLQFLSTKNTYMKYQIASHNFCFTEKIKNKREVMDRYKEANIQMLNNKVELQVKTEVIDKLKFSAMKKTMISRLLVSIAIIFGYHLFGRFELFLECERPKAHIFDIYGRCCTLIEAVILFYTLQRLIKQYEYPLVVMKVFSNPIYCKNQGDLLKWWQLRNYYRKYEIQTLSNVFHVIIGCLLLFTIICVAYIGVVFFFYPDFKWEADEYIFVFGIFCLCYVVLNMCNIAVRTHKEQIYHSTMLENEIIWVENNFSDVLEIAKIERIKQRILQSNPIAILGLNMTPTTIVVLRAYFIASASAILLELLFPND